MKIMRSYVISAYHLSTFAECIETSTECRKAQCDWHKWLLQPHSTHSIQGRKTFLYPFSKIPFSKFLYPEWPHRQCVGLAFWSRTFSADSVQQVLRFAAHISVCNTWSSGDTALCRGGCDQSIGSTISDAIVRSWLWLTATRSSPFGYFFNYCK